ncbi:MAG: COX15/CtaA family protein [Chitinophagaceae bacterium]
MLQESRNDRMIGRWLLLGVIMLMIQVVLGGITRLTGSGLSITEWKPILGALPPMNEADWNLAFEKYKQIGQFQFLNADFSLSDFKFIYFWEWFHRNWARFIGIAFIIPFAIFWVKGFFRREMVPGLLMLFVLGAAQGLIGWIMVASGLNEDNLYVSHFRLAIHFISAMVLIGTTYWFALRWTVPQDQVVSNVSLHRLTLLGLGLLTVQLIYGAFMAGLKAATQAPTWPLINGEFIPAAVWQQNWAHHPINIHLIHRMLAYAIVVWVIVWYLKAKKENQSPRFAQYRWVPVVLVMAQVCLGIVTVLLSTQLARNSFGPFEWVAQAHQVVAMLLSMSLLWSLFLLRKR